MRIRVIHIGIIIIAILCLVSCSDTPLIVTSDSDLVYASSHPAYTEKSEGWSDELLDIVGQINALDEEDITAYASFDEIGYDGEYTACLHIDYYKTDGMLYLLSLYVLPDDSVILRLLEQTPEDVQTTLAVGSFDDVGLAADITACCERLSRKGGDTLSVTGTAAVLTADKAEVLTAILPDGVGLATASGYVGEPVAYRDGLVYMFIVGDESAAGSMYYQLFEYDSEFTPISPAADRVFCGDEYTVYMNVDRSTGECEYFADSYDFDKRTELVLPDGCGLCFIDGERLYYTYGGSYYYCDISDGESAAVGISADEYILLAADGERLLFLSRDRGDSDDCRSLMLYDKNSGGRIVGTLHDDCNMEYMSSHTSALICGEYAYLTLVGDYAGAENTRRLARVNLADGESPAFGETTIISPSVDGHELISCGIELASDGDNVYSNAYFENGDGRVNLLYAVDSASGECRVYPEIPVDSVGLVRVFGDRLVIFEPNGGKLNTRIYELG